MAGTMVRTLTVEGPTLSPGRISNNRPVTTNPTTVSPRSSNLQLMIQIVSLSRHSGPMLTSHYLDSSHLDGPQKPVSGEQSSCGV